MMEPDVRLVLTTESDIETAQRLARELLERGIVACVTMATVRSMYQWKDEIEVAEEVQLLLKTTSHHIERVQGAISELHSYDVPELLVLEAEASQAYGRWLESAVVRLPVDGP